MSGPDTNTEKQERRHAPSLLGMKAIAIYFALLLIGVVFYSVFSADGEGASAYEGEQTAPVSVSE